MPAPSVENSTTLAVTTAEVHFGSAVWSPSIVVENSSGVPVAVATDGGTITSGTAAHEAMVPPGVTQVFGNTQPLLNTNTGVYKSNGGTGAFDQSNAPGWTAQQNNPAQYPAPSNFATYCSVFPVGTGTGNVTITFQ